MQFKAHKELQLYKTGIDDKIQGLTNRDVDTVKKCLLLQRKDERLE